MVLYENAVEQDSAGEAETTSVDFQTRFRLIWSEIGPRGLSGMWR